MLNPDLVEQMEGDIIGLDERIFHLLKHLLYLFLYNR
jgi:hypothetical protein